MLVPTPAGDDVAAAPADGLTAAIAGERPGPMGVAIVVVVWAAVAVRVFASMHPPMWPWTPMGIDGPAYSVGLVAFLATALVVLLRPPRAAGLLHLIIALQATAVLVLLSLNPDRDFLTVLLVLECYEAAFAFAGRTRVVWVALLVTLIGAALVTQDGLIHGLALALVPMAAGIVLTTYGIVSRELEADRATSERLVADLQAGRRQLEVYAGQVDELAAIDERSKLARELQESVSGTLTSALSASAEARELLDDPAAAAARLERLQTLAQQALAQMRRIITELRPASGESATGEAAPGAAASGEAASGEAMSGTAASAAAEPTEPPAGGAPTAVSTSAPDGSPTGETPTV